MAPAQEKLALQRELESRAVDPSENAKKAKLEGFCFVFVQFVVVFFKKTVLVLCVSEPFVWSSCSAGGFVHSLFAKESEAKKVNDDELNVMSLNVWFDEAFFEQRVKAQLETMKQMKPDVICLQVLLVLHFMFENSHFVCRRSLRIISKSSCPMFGCRSPCGCHTKKSTVSKRKSFFAFCLLLLFFKKPCPKGYGVAILSSIIPAGFSNTSLPSVMGRSLLTVQYECQWPAVSTVHLGE